MNANVMPALAALTGAIGNQIRQYGTVEKIPAQAVSNTRNDMYLASETIKHMKSDEQLKIRRRPSMTLMR